MSNRTLVIPASVCALGLTIGGWWWVMIYETPPHENLAFWLPFIVLLRAHDAILPIFASLLQFPTFAVIFIFANRRWQPLRVLAALIAVYALCVWVALAILKAGLWK